MIKNISKKNTTENSKMIENIEVCRIGKLWIYITRGQGVISKVLLRKIFPKSKYLQIIQEAQTFGIMNIHVFHTHAAVQNGGKIAQDSSEGDTSGLTVCVELVDERNKLEAFFTTQREMLGGNTVIYKEVEIGEY